MQKHYYGEREDTEWLEAGERTGEGVVLLAFAIKFDDFMNACAVVQAAIEAVVEALGETG